jgi:hypothetical protein
MESFRVVGLFQEDRHGDRHVVLNEHDDDRLCDANVPPTCPPAHHDLSFDFPMAMVVGSIAPLVERHARTLTWSAVLFNALGGWLRWVAACRMSYDIAFGSSVMIGLAAAVIMCLNTQISEQWFAPEERAWTTTLAVQLNYAGWCLAALLTPYVVTVATDLPGFCFRQVSTRVCVGTSTEYSHGLPGFCFRQALFVSLAVVAHTASQFALIESTELPQTTGSLRSSLAEFVSLLTMAIRCRRFAVEGTLYAAMAGISMAVPAVQDDILERAGMAQVCSEDCLVCMA